MKLHVFFSVHERSFGAVTDILRRDHGVALSGFVWGQSQKQYLERQGFAVSPLTVFTTDVLDRLDGQPADLAYLSAWEQRCGVPLQHMIFAERHLLATNSYERILRLAELLFRRVESDFDRARPEAYFSEDVACLTSYIHWAVAKDRGVRIVLLNNARFPNRVTTYSNPYQQWDLLDAIFPDTPDGLLTDEDYAGADEYLRSFRERPAQMPWMNRRANLPLGSQFDLDRLKLLVEHWRQDARNPTLRSPVEVVMQRGRRIVRNYIAEARGMFTRPVDGERYVLYPLHFQPEATTLVLAPYYLNQLAVIEDLAKSIPAGYRLYVKEHVVSRGRWPLQFYDAIRRTPGVRLLGPGEDSIALVRGAAAVSVITGTMGWEGLLLDKPVITLGRVFYNRYPGVHRAGAIAKQDWPALFQRAIHEHRPDPAMLRRFVACALRATFPGLTGNPSSLPEVMEPENLRQLARVVGAQIGLTPPLRGGQAAA